MRLSVVRLRRVIDILTGNNNYLRINGAPFGYGDVLSAMSYHISSIPLAIKQRQNTTRLITCHQKKLLISPDDRELIESIYKMQCAHDGIQNISGKTHVHIRVGSLGKDGTPTIGGKTPVFITMPVIMHRLPPDVENDIVTNAWILAKRCGPKTIYTLGLTVESASFHFHKVPNDASVLACDLSKGRRKPDGGIRVGHLTGSDGQDIDMVLDSMDGVERKLRHCDLLRSYSSSHHNNARDVFKQWMKGIELPEWLAEKTKGISKWENPRRLVSLVHAVIDAFYDREQLKRAWVHWKDERLIHTRKNDHNRKDLFDTFDVIKDFAVKFGFDPVFTYLYFWQKKEHTLVCNGEQFAQESLA